jgi:polar amino acid transport system substrate-binding protein
MKSSQEGEKEMKRNIALPLILVVVLSLVLSSCAPKSNAIRVATDATWPPFEIVDEQTKAIVGFDIDLLNAIAAKENLKIEYVNVGFDPLLAGMSQCQYDMAISSITITDERKKSMLFSDPYLEAGQIVTVRANETAIQGKDDLTGKTVGAQLGTTGAIEAQKMSGVTLRTYDTVDLAFLDLMNGQIDAVVADQPTAINFAVSNKGTLKTVGQPFTDESYGIAICQKNADLQQKINAGLAAVKSDGLIEQLKSKWLSTGS